MQKFRQTMAIVLSLLMVHSIFVAFAPTSQLFWRESIAHAESEAVDFVTVVSEPTKPQGVYIENSGNARIDMLVGRHETPSAVAGDSVRLALSLRYSVGDTNYESNASASFPDSILTYQSGTAMQLYDQRLTSLLSEAYVRISDVQSPDFPLTKNALGMKQTVLTSGANNGYAVFSGVSIAKNAAPGVYPISLEIGWRDAFGGSRHTVMAFTSVEVLSKAEARQLKALAEIENALLSTASADDALFTAQGMLAMGEYDVPVAQVGGLLSFAVPIQYQISNMRFGSNQDTEGAVIPFTAYRLPKFAYPPNEYDQAIAGLLPRVMITLHPEQAPDCPLDMGSLPYTQPLIADGLNSGYAVFRELAIREDAAPGTHFIALEATWLEAGQSTWMRTPLTMGIVVDHASEMGILVPETAA